MKKLYFFCWFFALSLTAPYRQRRQAFLRSIDDESSEETGIRLKWTDDENQSSEETGIRLKWPDEEVASNRNDGIIQQSGRSGSKAGEPVQKRKKHEDIPSEKSPRETVDNDPEKDEAMEQSSSTIVDNPNEEHGKTCYLSIKRKHYKEKSETRPTTSIDHGCNGKLVKYA